MTKSHQPIAEIRLAAKDGPVVGHKGVLIVDDPHAAKPLTPEEREAFVKLWFGEKLPTAKEKSNVDD